MSDPLLGKTVREFQVQARIATGGLGSVYRVHHKRLKLDRAMRVIPPDVVELAGTRRLFAEEAGLLGAIRHRNLVRFHDCGELEDGSLFLMVELLDGETLRARLRRT